MIKFFLAFALILSLNVSAATKANVTMPDTMKVAGKALVLNGQGIRKATFFGIKVYVGGLYLEKKSKDYSEFKDTNKVKHITMTFVRDVDADKIRSGWTDGFNNSHNSKTYNNKHLTQHQTK